MHKMMIRSASRCRRWHASLTSDPGRGRRLYLGSGGTHISLRSFSALHYRDRGRSSNSATSGSLALRRLGLGYQDYPLGSLDYTRRKHLSSSIDERRESTDASGADKAGGLKKFDDPAAPQDNENSTPVDKVWVHDTIGRSTSYMTLVKIPRGTGSNPISLRAIPRMCWGRYSVQSFHELSLTLERLCNVQARAQIECAILRYESLDWRNFTGTQSRAAHGGRVPSCGAALSVGGFLSQESAAGGGRSPVLWNMNRVVHVSSRHHPRSQATNSRNSRACRPWVPSRGHLGTIPSTPSSSSSATATATADGGQSRA